MAAYDYPIGMRGQRRRPRRVGLAPIATDPLEAWLEPLEDQPDMPTWWWALLGFSVGACAVAAAGITAVLVAWHRFWHNTY